MVSVAKSFDAPIKVQDSFHFSSVGVQKLMIADCFVRFLNCLNLSFFACWILNLKYSPETSTLKFGLCYFSIEFLFGMHTFRCTALTAVCMVLTTDQVLDISPDFSPQGQVADNVLEDSNKDIFEVRKMDEKFFCTKIIGQKRSIQLSKSWTSFWFGFRLVQCSLFSKIQL